MKQNFVIATLSMGLAAMAQTPAQPPAGAPASTQAAAPRQTPPPPPTIMGKVGVIRTRQAIMSTKEGQAAQAALATKFEPKKTEFARREGAIQELQDQLKKGGATMSDEAKGKLQRDIDAKSKQYERDIQDANEDLDQEQSKLMNDIGGKMVGVIISQYAAQNGYSMIIDVDNQQGPILWAAPSTDITADIIKLYDQQFPATAPAVKPQTPTKAPAPAPTGVKK